MAGESRQMNQHPQPAKTMKCFSLAPVHFQIAPDEMTPRGCLMCTWNGPLPLFRPLPAPIGVVKLSNTLLEPEKWAAHPIFFFFFLILQEQKKPLPFTLSVFVLGLALQAVSSLWKILPY